MKDCAEELGIKYWSLYSNIKNNTGNIKFFRNE